MTRKFTFFFCAVALSLFLGWGLYEDSQWTKLMQSEGCVYQESESFFGGREKWACDDGKEVYRP